MRAISKVMEKMATRSRVTSAMLAVVERFMAR
jgi:hypothetical protein